MFAYRGAYLRQQHPQKQSAPLANTPTPIPTRPRPMTQPRLLKVMRARWVYAPGATTYTQICRTAASAPLFLRAAELPACCRCWRWSRRRSVRHRQPGATTALGHAGHATRVLRRGRYRVADSDHGSAAQDLALRQTWVELFHMQGRGKSGTWSRGRGLVMDDRKTEVKRQQMSSLP